VLRCVRCPANPSPGPIVFARAGAAVHGDGALHARGRTRAAETTASIVCTANDPTSFSGSPRRADGRSAASGEGGELRRRCSAPAGNSCEPTPTDHPPRRRDVRGSVQDGSYFRARSSRPVAPDLRRHRSGALLDHPACRAPRHPRQRRLSGSSLDRVLTGSLRGGVDGATTLRTTGRTQRYYQTCRRAPCVPSAVRPAPRMISAWLTATRWKPRGRSSEPTVNASPPRVRARPSAKIESFSRPRIAQRISRAKKKFRLFRWA
jgi:hypothetical protein